MMASIGLPGLNGFVGEFLVLSGTFLTHRWWAVVATVGVVLAAALPAVGLPAGLPPASPTPANAAIRDLAWSERLVIAPLIVLIVFLGVYPKPVLDRITPSVNRLVAQVDAATHTRQPAVATGTAAPRAPDQLVRRQGRRRGRRRGAPTRTAAAGHVRTSATPRPVGPQRRHPDPPRGGERSLGGSP